MHALVKNLLLYIYIGPNNNINNIIFIGKLYNRFFMFKLLFLLMKS